MSGNRATYGDVFVRWMSLVDLPDVLEIEQGSADPRWTRSHFRHFLRRRNWFGLVVEVEGRVTGFAVYALGKSVLHIVRFASRRQCDLPAVAGPLLERLLETAEGHGKTSASYVLREQDQRAHDLFRSRGFKATRVLRSHYKDTGEDAFELRYTTPSSVGS